MILVATNAVHVVVATTIVVISFVIGAGAAVWLVRRFDPGLYAKRPGMGRWESIRRNSEDRAENPPTYYRALYPLMGLGFTIFAGARRGWPMGVVAAIVVLPFFVALGLWLGPLTRWSRAHPISTAGLFAPMNFVLVATVFSGISLWWCALGALVLAVLSAALGIRRRPRPNLSGGV